MAHIPGIDDRSNELSSINEFCLGYSKPFAINDLAQFVELSPPQIYNQIENDNRFIVFRSNNRDDDRYISKTMLLKCLININIHLSYINQYRLLVDNLAFLFDMDRRIQYDFKPVVEFGKALRLIEKTNVPEEYVFPIPFVISYLHDNKHKLAAHKCLRKLSSERHRTLLQTLSFTSWINLGLKCLDLRERAIELSYHGLLNHRKKTLEEIAEPLGLTRERVRQIHVKSVAKIKSSDKIIFFLSALYCLVLTESIGLVYRPSILNDTVTLRHLLNFFEIPYCCPPRWDSLMIGIEANSIERFILNLVTNLHEEWQYIVSFDKLITRVSYEFPMLTGDELVFVTKYLNNEIRRKLHMIGRIYCAMRSIGRPAHYTEIANVYNQIFPESTSDPVTVQTRLAPGIGPNGDHCFVYVGAMGTYGLADLGIVRPDNLHESALQIVIKENQNANGGVHFNYIFAELSKQRPYNSSSSITMAISMNPFLENLGNDYYRPKKNI